MKKDEYRDHKLTSEQNQIITKFQQCLPDKPVPIVRLAKEFGIKVWRAKMPLGTSGAITKNDDKYIIYGNRADPHTRRRFTYAHELAHYLLHQDLIGDGIEENVLFRSRLSNDQEIEANKIAADILMPLDVVNKLAEAGQYSLQELAEVFDVSRSAMLIRLGIPE